MLYAGFVPEDEEPHTSRATAAHRWLKQHSFAWWSTDRLLRIREMERRLETYHARMYPPWLNYFWHDDVNEEAYRDPDFARVRAHWTVEPRILQSHWTRQGILSALGHMAALVALCRAHDIPVTVAVYPWTVQVEARDVNSVQVQLWRRFARENDTGFVDLFPTLIGDEPFSEFQERYVLPGDAHWNAAGHARVAEGVWPHLEASLRRSAGDGGG